MVFGDLIRDCGQHTYLTVGNTNLYAVFNGLWTIYSCKHIWDGKTYTNDIICYRTSAHKNIDTHLEVLKKQ